MERDACGHLELLVYIHRELERPTASLHIKNNDPPRDATPRAGRLTLCSAELYNLARAIVLFVVGGGLEKTVIFL